MRHIKAQKIHWNTDIGAKKMERGNVSTISRWTMCFCFFGIFQFVASTPSWAASFDCAKATTKVEKMICQDAALSKLDEEMTQMYKRALASVTAPDNPLSKPGDRGWLKQEQIGWLKYTRNACITAECLKQAYGSQIIKLALAAQPAPKAYNYPNVWGTELPTDGTGRAEEAKIFEDHKGRIQILYAFNIPTQRVFRAYSFFDKVVLAEWHIYHGEGSDAEKKNAESRGHMADYEKEQVVRLLGDESRREAIPSITYSDGSSLEAEPFSGHFGYDVSFSPCNYRESLLIGRSRDKEPPPFSLVHKMTLKKMIIRLYPAPQSMRPEELCVCVGKMIDNRFSTRPSAADPRSLPGCNSEASHWGINYRGRALSAVLVNLKDGTFLLKDRGYDTVIRLHADLDLGMLDSPYFKERKDLFLADFDKLDMLLAETVGGWLQQQYKETSVQTYTVKDLLNVFMLFDQQVAARLPQRQLN